MSRNYYSPCDDPPAVGETIWVLGRCVDREEEPFAVTVVDVVKEPYRDSDRNRIRLRGFRDDPCHEWSIPQGSYGFYGAYFRTEVDCRGEYLRLLKNEDRRAKKEAEKRAERIENAKKMLKSARGKTCG